MSRLVNGLLVLFGAYLVIFYGIFPTGPCTSSCPGQLFPLPTITLPDPTVVGVVSIVVGAVALLVGLFSLVRGSKGAGVTASIGIGVVGAYLLLVRILLPPGPCRGEACNTASQFSPNVVLAWFSLIVGVIAILAGIVGFVRGSQSS